MIETPWYALKDVCALYGVTYATAMNKVRHGTFPVPVYKVGKLWVVDRAVHDAYFARFRADGLAAIQSTESGQGTRRD